MNEKLDEPLVVVLRVIDDQSLRRLIGLALNEQRRRLRLTLKKCGEYSREELPRVIFTEK